ncbi:hypothetical protein KJ966_03735 [bacterium]|nr:hypothetical protein [bacterium]
MDTQNIKGPQIADIDTFKRQVELFVDHHRKQQDLPENREKVKNQTLEEHIDYSPILTDKDVDVFFEKNQEFQVAAEVVEEVHRALKNMQESVNHLSAKKRFFILETVNFFRNQISIGKLIPALLILEGEDQKKAICEFILPTFLSINKNVELLVADDKLFDPKTLHIERGLLYTFISDLAKTLIGLFKDDFVSGLGDINSPIEFFLTAFEPGTFRIKSNINTESSFIYQEIIDEESVVRKITLDFVTMIQSHSSLYNYAVKRHLYYKSFLHGLTKPGRFKEMDPIDVSRILAGCLVANKQLRPEDELIDSMIDEELFQEKTTLLAKKQFFDRLTPTTIHKLIVRMKVSLQHLSRTDFSEEFQEIQRMSVRTILKTIWSGIIQVIDKSVSKAAEPIVKVLDIIRSTYNAFIKETSEEEKAEFDSVSGRDADLTYKNGEIIPKNLESFAIMTQHFQMVEPDIIGFRGEHEGATHKDFGYNTRIFQKNENLLMDFYDCIERLFASLNNNNKVKEIRFENQSRIVEHAVSYTFGNYMISIGITHLKTANSIIIEEKDLFPYILLFSETNKKKFGRILSREVVINGKLKIFGEVEFSNKNAVLYYEALYLILHLLPEKAWKAKDTQSCVGFLIEELQNFKAKSGRLIYCVNIPKKIPG